MIGIDAKPSRLTKVSTTAFLKAKVVDSLNSKLQSVGTACLTFKAAILFKAADCCSFRGFCGSFWLDCPTKIQT
jgi:hypothetical protein